MAEFWSSSARDGDHRVYGVGGPRLLRRAVLASWRPGVLASRRPGVLASWRPAPPPEKGKASPKGGKKKPAASYSRTGEARTTLGDGALNFRVRNGNGCDNSSMATGKKPFSWELKRLTTHNEMRGMISHHVKF